MRHFRIKFYNLVTIDCRCMDPVLWMIGDTLSVWPEKNQVLTFWNEQFPSFILRSPDALLFSSLIPKETTEKTFSYLSIEGWSKVLCSLQPDILTEGVATQLNVQPDVSSLGPAPGSLYLVQTISIFLVLLQKTPAHCSQEKPPWMKCTILCCI